MIKFSHVYKTYPGPIHALRDIDVEIKKGEFVFLTGPSGSGKTTLFRMLSAFDQPTSGRIEVAGFNISKMSHHQVSQFRRQIGVVFQDFRLLKDRSIFENVALPLQILGVKKDEIVDRVEHALFEVGLIEKADQLPEFISGGEQQRTAIARAIIHQPGLLIADEPTGNLDPQLSEDIMDLFERVSDQGTTVFIATHDHSMVKRRGHRRIELRAGMIANTQESEAGSEADL